MNPISALHSTPKAWSVGSVLASYAESFTARLERGRYSAITTNTYLGGVLYLARCSTS